MNNSVPPAIDQSKTTAIGVGTREIAVLAAAAFLVLFVFIMPVSIVFKIGFSVLLGGGGVALAFGRVNRNTTFEKHLMDRLDFSKRSRSFRRGASRSVPSAPSRKVVAEPVMTRTSSKSAAPASVPLSGSISATVASDSFVGNELPKRAPSFKPNLPEFKGKPLFTMEPIDLNVNVLFTILGVAFLAALLSWLWLGGYAELQLLVNSTLR